MSHAGITAVLAKGKSQKQKVKKVKRERDSRATFINFHFVFSPVFFFFSNKRHEQKNSTGKPPLNK